jgi:seryl-tRNA synthetase
VIEVNNKERLKEIKEWFYETFKNDSERNRHVMNYKWLISQADKVEQLEQEIQGLKAIEIASLSEINHLDDEIDNLKRQLQQAQAKIERYEKALRKIIDESICRGEDCTWVDTCYAVIARKALEGDR